MRRVGEDEKPLVCALLATENNSEELKKFILQVKELKNKTKFLSHQPKWLNYQWILLINNEIR